MAVETVEVNCYLNLISNGSTSANGVTTADAPFIDFEEDDIDFNDIIDY